jgi:hypothetical protein
VTAAERPATPAERAAEAAVGARWHEASAWALVSIAADLADIRRELHWQRRHASADARRG